MKLDQRDYLFTGGSGLIGSFFINSLKKSSSKLDFVSPLHSEMDISDLDSVKRYFDLYSPKIVVNFAAFRNATEAEKQRGDKAGSVWRTNVLGSKNIALVCKSHGAYLVHISSDYVFSGHHKSPGPYDEDDVSNHKEKYLSWYGLTKREAERQILDVSNKAAIIRISNVSLPNNRPELDYIGKILWLYDQKKLYPMFDDQYLTLAYIPLLTKMIKKLKVKKIAGVFHLASTNLCTPFELAEYLLEGARGQKKAVVPISINTFLKSSPVRYPKFGGLKSDKTQIKLGIKFLSWQEIVEKFIKDNQK